MQKVIRFIGVGNLSVRQIKEAQEYTKNRIIANQVEYNLLARNGGHVTNDMESRIIPYCQKKQYNHYCVETSGQR
ncbi:MAG: hypothetical protein D8M57_15785 [Candidatus Scalindua sp. AMX11]|nr:MAG: hypothetical protein DWQ00_08320 [Candidatus Scalindua sp.]NOG84947.1 hypothetical protein [Planctomycetota bacterium]RZV85005.1 MAG: hypothetical protein EX341_08375 [Candidatus Scalindua sp. SCAELEC01]TDE63904.1 MAG: hypothetical protein D8M57_15785 [Candidatus Scalindua sp. AMX11]GJQ60682.1 MAG: hypothetical protein SCALA701_34830 [Candidatus Scalindua sp.]